MDALDLEVATELVTAEARVSALLLRNIVGALIAKGAMDEHEVAGALLRTQTQAKLADDAEAEEGRITDAHARTAELTVQEWDRYFGLEPSLYALRKEEERWKAGGENGPHPFSEERIVAVLSA
ncbi:hypothetical protein [Shinella sp.]|uniref:hypothetical protein n=1 Tax=Shinella sp. TaxID=1870904 RepID=UPI0029ACA3D0|nr:hypothetical protein [Shinella sp.]MDX3978927.1 hypothetical protein [Shinella sp.]